MNADATTQGDALSGEMQKCLTGELSNRFSAR